MLKNLPERLKLELCQRLNLASDSPDLKVIAIHERAHAAWFGGSIALSVQSFAPWLIYREQFDRFGPAIFES